MNNLASEATSTPVLAGSEALALGATPPPLFCMAAGCLNSKETSQQEHWLKDFII